MKIGRNDPCPCGSGLKFKKCHLGREDELVLAQMEEDQRQVGKRIVALPAVTYGNAQTFAQALDMKQLTGKEMGIKFIDFSQYLKAAGKRDSSKQASASQIINTNKTKEDDPDNIYVAVTPDINDSTLIHQLAHVVGFLRGDLPLPGEYAQLAEEKQMPVEHLDHPQEFGELLDMLRKKFEVQLDAEDWIISYLAQHEMLIPGEDIAGGDAEIITYRSAMILNFLRKHGEEINEAILSRDGYIGKQE